MAKPLLLIVAPCESQSGYGKHSVDLIRSVMALNKFNIVIFPINWGNTPLNALTEDKDNDILSKISRNRQLPRKPDVVVHISVPKEFSPIGEYNIGITAGIETTIMPADWMEGVNRMDLIIVPSEHAKQVLQKTEFTKNHPQTKQPMGQLKCERTTEVLFEGSDANIYRRIPPPYSKLLEEQMNEVKEDWAFLVVGHWLQGQIGHDRKDIGMTIKVFLETFKGVENKPAMVMKISSATFSVMDKNDMLKRIREVRKSICPNPVDEKLLPNIYLLHGQLSDFEMNDLYNHPKIKAMVSFTKGEGFGRPLLEFSMSGKPIIASAWSGQIDFLDKDFTMLLPGKVEQVNPSAVNDFIIKESHWFTIDYNTASRAMSEMYNNYHKYLSKAKKLMYQNKNNFSLKAMNQKMALLFNKYVPDFPEELELKIPQSLKASKKIKLPKLKKI